MNEYRTEQEALWAGTFGDDCADRNRGEHLIASNLALFARVLAHATQIRSVIEFGASIGLNLLAIRQLLPEARLSAVEINEKAVAELCKVPALDVYHRSIFQFTPEQTYDLVLDQGGPYSSGTKRVGGCLRSAPSEQQPIYLCRRVLQSDSRFCELPRSRGKLFKRDSAGEML
jgi:spore coat polysaccharide biosynthesis protein SpsF